ncbi:MAG: helix-turn-helix domain-containing protein [Paracoccus sp. (in: a-proteobacteria)]|nr:helix-turn-helix domain-containing protein [Paracoccus sp. (in: a-proteobacteria)]
MTNIAQIQSAVLRAIGASCLTTAEIAVATELKGPQVWAATGKLIARGYVERREIGCFALTSDGQDAHALGADIGLGPVTRTQRPRRRAFGHTLRQRAWNAMAVTRVFTVPDLVTAAARDHDKLPDDNIRRFCSRLAKAGYLRVKPSRRPDHRPNSNGHKIFEVIKHTGPIAPTYLSARKSVLDRNTGEEFPV